MWGRRQIHLRPPVSAPREGQRSFSMFGGSIWAKTWRVTCEPIPHTFRGKFSNTRNKPRVHALKDKHWFFWLVCQYQCETRNIENFRKKRAKHQKSLSLKETPTVNLSLVDTNKNLVFFAKTPVIVWFCVLSNCHLTQSVPYGCFARRIPKDLDKVLRKAEQSGYKRNNRSESFPFWNLSPNLRATTQVRHLFLCQHLWTSPTHRTRQNSTGAQSLLQLEDFLEQRVDAGDLLQRVRKYLHGGRGDLNWDRSRYLPNQHATHLVKYLKNYWTDFNHFWTQDRLPHGPDHIQKWSLNSFSELRKSTFCVQIGNKMVPAICLLMTSQPHQRQVPGCR